MSEDHRLEGTVEHDEHDDVGEEFEEEDVWAPDPAVVDAPTAAIPVYEDEPAGRVSAPRTEQRLGRWALVIAAIVGFTIVVICLAAAVGAGRRVNTLERRVKALETSPASASGDTSLEPRLAALESRLSSAPSGSVDAATINSINAQIAALDARIKALPAATTDTSAINAAISKLQRDVQKVLVCVQAHEDRLNGRDAQFACSV